MREYEYPVGDERRGKLRRGTRIVNRRAREYTEPINSVMGYAGSIELRPEAETESGGEEAPGRKGLERNIEAKRK